MRFHFLTFFLSLTLHGSLFAGALLLYNLGSAQPEKGAYRVSLVQFAPAPASGRLPAAEMQPVSAPDIPAATPRPQPASTSKAREEKRSSSRARPSGQVASSSAEKKEPRQSFGPAAQSAGQAPIFGEAAAGTAQNGPAVAEETRTYDLSAVDQRPSISCGAMPVYPESARRKKLQGEVVVRLVVDTAGHARQCAIESSKPAGVFDQAALTAAAKTRFTPGKIGGRPVNTTVFIPYKFALN